MASQSGIETKFAVQFARAKKTRRKGSFFTRFHFHSSISGGAVTVDTDKIMTTSYHRMASDESILPPASVPTVVLPENASVTANNGDEVVIRLDAEEERLFTTLIQAADAFQQGTVQLESQSPHRIDIRVAGGWVRDKLLGRHTHDVDIAIDTVSGVEMATIVQRHLQREAPQEVHRMGVIAANPSQSKHLETATMRVYTIDVDFCNLRAQEIYQAHSRIPTTQFGSPLEDAQRRDFTINALFFNLRTHQVEDWTGRGLQDLKARLLVTPLCPTTTFHDDPLRVLRAIRFAVRYNMKLDRALEESCRDPEVHETLHVKISRERVGKELEAMLSGKSAKPQEALETIGRLGLADSVFCLPSADVGVLQGRILGHSWNERDATRLETMGWEEACQIIPLLPRVLEAYLQYVQAMPNHIITQADLRLLHLSVFLTPFRHLYYKDKKGKMISAVTFMVKESLKFKNTDAFAIATIMEHVDSWKEFITTSRSVPTRRLDAGLMLESCKNLWVTCLLVATVLKARETQEPTQQWIQASLNLYRRIVDMGLDECWNMRPLLNGREVIQCLQLPPGPMVQMFLKEQMRWMLEHPNGTREECERFLHRKKHEMEKPKHGSPIATAHRKMSQ